MKGIKGERNAYGILSTLNVELVGAGFDYQGSRIQRDNRKPWIMYETARGEPADLEAFDAVLLAQRYTHYQSSLELEEGEEPETFPQHGIPGRGQRYTQYRYMRKDEDGHISEVLYVTTRFYDAGKGKKDYTSFEHIFY